MSTLLRILNWLKHDIQRSHHIKNVNVFPFAGIYSYKMSTTTSSTDVGTPIHVSSASFVNEGINTNYPTSEDQLDLDEAIDLDDHVTDQVDSHVTQRMKLSVSDDSNEEASTAEEGRDSVPNYESTTTDNVIDALEPIDYIESNPRLHPPSELRYHANGSMICRHGNEAVPSPPGHRYENWSVMLQMDDGFKKSESIYVTCAYTLYTARCDLYVLYVWLTLISF